MRKRGPPSASFASAAGPDWQQSSGRRGSRFAARMRVAAVAGEAALDGSEDPHERVVGRRRQVPNTPGHAGCVNTVSWSGDGVYLASGSDDTSVGIWQFAMTEGAGVPPAAATAAIKSDSVSPFGRRVTSTASERRLSRERSELEQLWEDTGKCVFQPPREISFGKGAVHDAATTLKVEECNADQSAAQWGLRQVAKVYPGHSHNIFTTEFAPNSGNGTIISAGMDGDLRLSYIERAAAPPGLPSFLVDSMRGDPSSSDTTPQSELLAEFDGFVFNARFLPGSPDVFLTTHQDGCVRLWDLRESRARNPQAADRDYVDTRHVLLRVTGDLGAGRGSVFGGPSDGPCNTLAFAPDGFRIAMGGGDPFVRVADIRVASQWDDISGYNPKFDDTSSNQRLLGRICPKPVLDRYRETTDARSVIGFRFRGQSAFVTSVQWSHNSWDSSVGRRCGGGDLLINYSTDSVFLVDAETALSEHAQFVTSPLQEDLDGSGSESDAPALPDGSIGTAFAQEYTGRRNVQTFLKEARFVLGGGYIATGCDSGNLFIWDRATARCVQVLKADDSVVNSIAPHPFLPVMAVSGIDSSIKIIAPAAHARPLRLDGDETELPSQDEYSRKARRIMDANERSTARAQGGEGSDSEDDSEEGGLGGIPISRLFALLSQMQEQARQAGVQTESSSDGEDEVISPARAALDRATELRTEANALFRGGEFSEAAETYTEIIDSVLDPALADEMLEEEGGSSEAAAGAEAEGTASVRIRLQRSRLLVLQNRAACFLRMERFQDCVEDCDEVIANAEPGVSLGKARYRRGMAHTKLGNFNEAHADLTAAIETFPGDAAVQRAMDELQESMRDSS
jgi:WD40 repeat protein/TolA-binding protein